MTYLERLLLRSFEAAVMLAAMIASAVFAAYTGGDPDRAIIISGFLYLVLRNQ